MNWNEPPWVLYRSRRDNARSVFAGVPVHDVENPLDDHGTDGRQDYSVDMYVPDTALADGAGGILAINLTEVFSGE